MTADYRPAVIIAGNILRDSCSWHMHDKKHPCSCNGSGDHLTEAGHRLLEMIRQELTPDLSGWKDNTR